jgi:hypothetical protein
VTREEEETPRAATAGLCLRCRHAQEIVSDRRSRFILCSLSASDARFVKYPRLPVVQCPGFVAEPEET